MTQEEYKQLRHQAQQQMIADYHWLLSQPRQPRQWRCPRRWLIELVHDVNDRQEMLDDLHRPCSSECSTRDSSSTSAPPCP